RPPPTRSTEFADGGRPSVGTRDLSGVSDVTELAPHERERGARADEREPERRGDPPRLGEDAPERLPDDAAAEHADHVDRADATLELRRDGALADRVGHGAPHERVRPEHDHDRE